MSFNSYLNSVDWFKPSLSIPDCKESDQSINTHASVCKSVRIDYSSKF